MTITRFVQASICTLLPVLGQEVTWSEVTGVLSSDVNGALGKAQCSAALCLHVLSTVQFSVLLKNSTKTGPINIIIAIKTALWQSSKKSYCVLVHGPRLKTKKLTKCDSRKLKFPTKPHNNHNTWNAAFNTKLVLHQQLATCMHKKEDHEGKGLLHVAFHSVCDYCEVLCEILIFGYHISLIS